MYIQYFPIDKYYVENKNSYLEIILKNKKKKQMQFILHSTQHEETRRVTYVTSLRSMAPLGLAMVRSLSE